MKLLGLEGKQVLITGASSGIGAGMAKVLAEAGCRLVLHFNRNASGIEETLNAVQAIGAEAEVLQCDFTQLETVRPFFDEAWQIFDGLDA